MVMERLYGTVDILKFTMLWNAINMRHARIYNAALKSYAIILLLFPRNSVTFSDLVIGIRYVKYTR
jgi:hypothetical protein